MPVVTKLVFIAGAIQAASAVKVYESHEGPAAMTGAPGDLASIEIGQLLSTACTPLTIYTEECHVVTIVTTSESVVDTTSEVITETSVPVTSDIISTSVEIEATSSEGITDPTEEVTAAAAGMNILLQGVYALLTVAAFIL